MAENWKLTSVPGPLRTLLVGHVGVDIVRIEI